MTKRTALAALLLAVLLPACGGNSTSPTPVVSLNGNYAGAITDSLYGGGTLLLTSSQTGNQITGTYSSQFPAAGIQGGGLVSGTVNNSQTLSATLQPSVPTACPYQLTGSITNSGANISGTFAAFNCSLTETGTFNLSRQ